MVEVIRVVWMLKLMVIIHKISVPGWMIQYIMYVPLRASGISAIDRNDKAILPVVCRNLDSI